MKTKLTLLVGLAIGYVLGSRAGRERYEQMRSGVGRITHRQVMTQPTP